MLPEIEIVQGTDDKFLCFKTDDFISRHIRSNGAWGEMESNLAILMSTGFPNPLILDVGANLGAFTVPVAKRLEQAGGSVHAFEPQRVIFQQLCGNVVLNRLENVFTYNVALGSKPGVMTIPTIDYHRTKNIGAVSLIPEIQKVSQVVFSENTVENITMLSIDTLNLKRGCTFLKIDVEGFESEVIKGALNFIEINQFPPILFEEWRKGKFTGAAEHAVEQRQAQTRGTLSTMGYAFTRIGTDVLAQHPGGLARVALIQRPNNIVNIVREN